MCDGSFRSELLLPREQTSTRHITQAAAVPRVYSLDRVCAAQRRCADVGFRWWNCLCLKPSNQRDCCWMNIMVLTFHPCWTYGVLLGEAHWVAEHNHCTYNRSVGCWIKALPVCSPTRQMKLIWADFLHLQMHIDLKLPPPATMSKLCCTSVFTYKLSNPREGATSSRSRRSVSCVSCERDKPMMSTHAPVCIYSPTCM